jgi:O-antigen/teichoic acid export membrane protein
MLKPSIHQTVFTIGHLRAHLQTPLFRNGYTLLISGLLSSGLGMLYWVLAARTYPTATLGLNSAAISAMMFVSGLAQLSLNGALVRFIPQAGPTSFRLVLAAYGVSLGLGLMGGSVFVLGVDQWTPKLHAFFESQSASIGFVLSVMVWCIFALQDSVLAGLRQPIWVPIENSLVAAGKLFLLFGLATISPDYGIFAAWMIPAVLSLAPINLLIFYRLLPQHIQIAQQQITPAAPSQIIRFVLGNYLGTLAFLAYTTLLPILIASQAGPEANAFFYMPWMITIALQLVASNLTTSLTVEAVHDENQLGLLCYRVLLQSLRLLAPLVMFVVLAAPFLLSVFGKAYADEGATLLRLLALSAIPNLLGMLYISLARIQQRASGVVIAQGLLGILLVGLSYLLLPIYGITGVGWAALISQCTIALLAFFSPLRPLLLQGRIIHKNTLEVLCMS